MKTQADLTHIFPLVSGTLTGGNGSAVAFTGADISASSLTIKTGTSASGQLTVGGAVIGSLSFTIITPERFAGVDWKGSTVRIVLTCDGTPCDMGTYYVSTHKESGGVIAVTAYDVLSVLDQSFIQALGLTFPTTAGALVGAIASAHGLAVSGLRDPAFAIAELDEGTTQRNALSFVAQAMGQFVRASGSSLVFGWYDLAGARDGGNCFSHQFGTSDVTVTGLRVSDGDNKTTQDRGADGYRIEISGNPLITEANISAVADVIASAVVGMSFRAGEADIVASPAYDAGDVLLVNTLTERGVRVILSNMTYTPDVVMGISSDAEDDDLNFYSPPFVRTQDLTNPNSPISKAISDANSSNRAVQALNLQAQRVHLYPYGIGTHIYNTTGSGLVVEDIAGGTHLSPCMIDIPAQTVTVPGISELTKEKPFTIQIMGALRTPDRISAEIPSTTYEPITITGVWEETNAGSGVIKLNVTNDFSYENPVTIFPQGSKTGLDSFGLYLVMFRPGYRVTDTTFTQYTHLIGDNTTGWVISRHVSDDSSSWNP